MVLAYMLQSQVVLPTWVGAVTAVSLVIIALSFLSIAVGALLAFKKIAGVLKGLHEDIVPAVRSIRDIADKGKGLVDVVKNETDALARTSRRLRRRALFFAFRG